MPVRLREQLAGAAGLITVTDHRWTGLRSLLPGGTPSKMAESFHQIVICSLGLRDGVVSGIPFWYLKGIERAC